MKVETVFGRILKESRKRAGLSQEALALECKIDRTYISLLERGKRQPTLNMLFKISKVLNVPAHKMVEQIEEQTKLI
jgi:transcriptional regulator with XRE-family HTH domain